MIMSGKMLLDWLSLKRSEPKAAHAARLIERAMARVSAEARCLTRDLGGSAGTHEMGDAVAKAIDTA